MKLPTSIVLLALAACASTPADHTAAQAIVDRVAARHHDVVRLTIHAVPRGADASRIVASNVPDKIGRASDPEDRPRCGRSSR